MEKGEGLFAEAVGREVVKIILSVFAADDLAAADAANLDRAALEDGMLAHCDLPVARDGAFAVAPDAADGSAFQIHNY